MSPDYVQRIEVAEAVAWRSDVHEKALVRHFNQPGMEREVRQSYSLGVPVETRMESRAGFAVYECARG